VFSLVDFGTIDNPDLLTPCWHLYQSERSQFKVWTSIEYSPHVPSRTVSKWKLEKINEIFLRPVYVRGRKVSKFRKRRQLLGQ